MNEVEKFEHAGKTVTIYYDEDPPNPLKDYDTMVTLACWHRRVDLGNMQIQPCSEEDFRAEAESNGEEILALLPVYLYQHSGMTIRTTPFGCRWDSGQVGWAYVTKAGAEKMGCIGTYQDRETGETKAYDEAFFLDAIRGEVETYDLYLTGQCYGYEVTGADDDHLDSCWGFLGDLDYVRSEARSAAEHSKDPAVVREEAAANAKGSYEGGVVSVGTVTIIPTRTLVAVVVGDERRTLPEGSTDANAFEAIGPFVKFKEYTFAYVGPKSETIVLVEQIMPNEPAVEATKRLEKRVSDFEGAS